jgi:nucleotide-binding universal stress UspA family protein
VIIEGGGPARGQEAPGAWVDEIVARSSRDGIALKRHAMAGRALAEIRAYAAAQSPDLLVVGAKRTATGRNFLGLAPPLMEQPPAPVLIARAPFRGLRRILLAYDGYPHSRAAARFLTRLPLPPDVEVTVLHVLTEVPRISVEPASAPTGPRLARSLTSFTVQDTPNPEQVRAGQAILASALDGLRTAGLRARGQLAHGDAAAAIVRQASASHADLIVAGSRGLSRVWGVLLGSVSRELTRTARRSVLIVSADERAPGPETTAPGAPEA